MRRNCNAMENMAMKQGMSIGKRQAGRLFNDLKTFVLRSLNTAKNDSHEWEKIHYDL